MQALQLAVGVVGWLLASCLHWLVGVFWHCSSVRPKYMAALLLHLNNSAHRPDIGYAAWSGYLVEWYNKMECRLCSLLLVWLSGFWQAACTGWWVFFGTTVLLGLSTWLHY